MYIATALIVLMAYRYSATLEGFEEDDTLRARVVDEFIDQKGSRPTLEQMSTVLDNLSEDTSIAAEVAKVIDAMSPEDKRLKVVIDDFKIQSGFKPSIQQLNMVMNALDSGEITENQISEKVGEVLSTKTESADVYRVVFDTFRNLKGGRPTAEEFDVALDAIMDGTIEISGIGDYVQKIIDREVEVPDPPPPNYADAPKDFEINTIIIKEFLEHAGRNPRLDELNRIKNSVTSVDQIPDFIKSTFPEASVIKKNVLAAAQMSGEDVSMAQIDRIVREIKEGKVSLGDVIASYTDTKSKDVDTLPDLDDNEFIEETYKSQTGSEIDPDTALFLIAKLREWKGDREKMFNFIVTLSIAIGDNGENPVFELIKEVSHNLSPSDLQSASDEWNWSQVSRTPTIGESVSHKMTSMSKAFNMNLADTDKLILAATRPPSGPSHDIYYEGSDMVLRDDVYWEYPNERMPCPNQNCGDPTENFAQSSLIGTLLHKAEKTNVGTLMPSFEFKNLPPEVL